MQRQAANGHAAVAAVVAAAVAAAAVAWVAAIAWDADGTEHDIAYSATSLSVEHL